MLANRTSPSVSVRNRKSDTAMEFSNSTVTDIRGQKQNPEMHVTCVA